MKLFKSTYHFKLNFIKLKKTVLKINANKSMKYKDYTIQDYKLSKLLHLHNLKLYFETLRHNKMPYGRNTIF